jgi:hypothetical protein
VPQKNQKKSRAPSKTEQASEKKNKSQEKPEKICRCNPKIKGYKGCYGAEDWRKTGNKL